MVLLNLFLSFFRIGLFAIGGAYSFLPLIEKEVVERYNWLTKEEFLDILGAVQVFPGAISIKYATYTGYKIAGICGAMAANLGNLFAPAVIVILSSFYYLKYRKLPVVKGAFDAVQLAVFAMIIAVAIKLVNVNQLLHARSLLIIAGSFLVFIFSEIHPAFIIVGAGIIGALLSLFRLS